MIDKVPVELHNAVMGVVVEAILCFTPQNALPPAHFPQPDQHKVPLANQGYAQNIPCAQNQGYGLNQGYGPKQLYGRNPGYAQPHPHHLWPTKCMEIV